MSHMVSPDQLRDWVARSIPGEDVVYGQGERPRREVALYARQLQDAGLVALTSKRERDGFRFIAQRRAGAFEALQARRAVGNRGRFKRKAVLATAETLILRALKRAAARSRPCPTNAELAAAAGLSGAIAASYRVRRLAQRGLIIVEEPSPIERRVVTIVATRQKTVRALV